MTEHPIIFAAPSVREILAGRKTQTRRVVRPGGKLAGQHVRWWEPMSMVPALWGGFDGLGRLGTCSCPYGEAGDRLWVRETWCELDPDHYEQPGKPREMLSIRYGPRRNGCAYRADTSPDGERIRVDYGYRWRSPIHQPRWASRLTLEVVGVRVERLQAISEEDARAEGAPPEDPDEDHGPGAGSYRFGFAHLWDEINGARPGCGWSANPFVWRVEFRHITPNANEATP